MHLISPWVSTSSYSWSSPRRRLLSLQCFVQISPWEVLEHDRHCSRSTANFFDARLRRPYVPDHMQVTLTHLNSIGRAPMKISMQRRRPLVSLSQQITKRCQRFLSVAMTPVTCRAQHPPLIADRWHHRLLTCTVFTTQQAGTLSERGATALCSGRRQARWQAR